MGCACTKQQRRSCEIPAVLAAQTCFNVAEVEKLYELFSKLGSCVVDDGFISKEEFRIGLLRNSKKQNFFAGRMFTLFDSKDDGLIDFGEFVRALSIFHPDAPEEDKISFSFQLYDVSRAGYIEPEEVKKMILALLDESDLIIPDDLIQAIVDKTFEEADSKADGKIDSEEWRDFVAKTPSLLKNMTIPYLKDITAAFPSFTLSTEKEHEIDSFF
ncbi:calcineurin b-like protein [Ancistrocladus abbreviatus]